MTLSPLARDLRAKATRALASARELQERDPDGSVNGCYYAMFDIARAALLNAGVGEDELPRTHSGVISAFSKHAVQTGRVDLKLSGITGGLSRNRWRRYGARRARIGYSIGNGMLASQKDAVVLNLLTEVPRTITAMMWTTVSVISL